MNKSTIWSKIFYYGWIPIVAVIILLKMFLPVSPSLLAKNYVEKSKEIVNTQTKYFKYLAVTSSDNYIYVKMQLLNDVYTTKEERKNLSDVLYKIIINGQTCKNEETLNLLNNDVVFVYVYFDKEGKKIDDIFIDKSSCK